MVSLTVVISQALTFIQDKAIVLDHINNRKTIIQQTTVLSQNIQNHLVTTQ